MRSRLRVLGRFVGSVVWALGAVGAGTVADDDPRTRALALYDAGDYAAALPLLEKLAADAPDGPMLYRLYFAQQATGTEGARETQVRARETLEAELPEAKGLAVPFYLSNIYRASGKLSDARQVAEQAASAVDSGKIPAPATALDAFRLGKLYEDIERDDDAAKWYERSVELAGKSDEAVPLVRQAARFLADRAFAAEDYDAAAKYYAQIPDEDVSIEDLNQLAKLNLQREAYLPAAAVWYRAVRLQPATGDGFRYGAQLATQAHEAKPLPAKDPEGRPWSEIPPQDLERIMYESASAAREELEKAAILEPDAKRDWEAQQKVWELRKTFLAAALEFTLRGLPIRETAFQAGYAPMIFHSRRWRVADMRRAREAENK